ncbi:helix-turn-helix domain-containing protein [Maribellus sediminis]|uniref:helix-turn-helix domain-containing protein n=1 Tax=Maribellus sediminis TaxID=2696285 RepID=UPI001430B22D|nr:helix-turn-helix transcriptional regulator [Maribellus sediminis]
MGQLPPYLGLGSSLLRIMKLGSTIKRLRKEKNIRQVDFAKQCGISQTYLSQLENDDRNPTIDVLERISKTLEVPYPVLSFLSLTEDDVSEEKRDMYQRMQKVMFGLVEDVFL